MVSYDFEEHPTWRLDVVILSQCTSPAALLALIMAKAADAVVVDASLVPGLFALRLAAHRALCAHGACKLAAASLHAEVVYALQGGKNVGEALRLLAPTSVTPALLVARLVQGKDSAPFEQWAAWARGVAQGVVVEPASFFACATPGGGSYAAQGGGLDSARALAAYKLDKGGVGEVGAMGGLHAAVVARIALQDVGGWS
jgi:hypothetical protein